MSAARVLSEVLERAADSRGRFVFVDDDGAEHVRTFEALHQEALRIGGMLLNDGLNPGDHVALVLPEPEAFVCSFFGAVMAGLVPVPMYPPVNIGQLEAYLQNTHHILQAASARVVLTTGPLQQLLAMAAGDGPCRVRVLEELEGPALSSAAPVRPDDVSFLQFTSGSTSRPKGVMLSHTALLANVDAIAHWNRATERDVAVSWLPLYHDMGLIGMLMGTLWVRAQAVLMSPIVFAKYPGTWLSLISRHRATISFAPNFAYALATRRVREHDIAALDLSTWRIAGCGAEPVQAATLQAFAARFAPGGFRETAFCPCYGMAEHTLAITLPALDRPLRVDHVRGTDLAERGRAAPCSEAEHGARAFVSCGMPLRGHGLRIVNEDLQPLKDREIGEVLVSGPSVMQGYYGQEQQSGTALRDGWLRTGDLGYLADGELFVCGRKKDLVILHGRNYYPQDIEWAVHAVPGVRSGGVVAFGSGAFGEKERLIIVSEVTGGPQTGEASLALTRAITTCVSDAFGIRPDEVVLVPAGTLSKTSSGKLQRARTRSLYETGRLTRMEEE